MNNPFLKIFFWLCIPLVGFSQKKLFFQDNNAQQLQLTENAQPIEFNSNKTIEIDESGYYIIQTALYFNYTLKENTKTSDFIELAIELRKQDGSLLEIASQSLSKTQRQGFAQLQTPKSIFYLQKNEKVCVFFRIKNGLQLLEKAPSIIAPPKHLYNKFLHIEQL